MMNDLPYQQHPEVCIQCNTEERLSTLCPRRTPPPTGRKSTRGWMLQLEIVTLQPGCSPT